MHHLSTHETCYYLSEWNDVSPGLLPDTSLLCNIKNDNHENFSSHRFKYYSADGIVDNLQLDIKEDTTEKRGNIINMNSANTNHKYLNSCMTKVKI